MSSPTTEEKKFTSIDHIESQAATRIGTPEPTDEKVIEQENIQDASAAVDLQKNQTIREAVRMFPQAICWSLVFSTAIVMEGYDQILLGQLYAQPAFAERYGEWEPNSQTYQIPSQWQIGLGIGLQVGSIIGLQITGTATDRFGYRRVMGFGLVILTAFLFIPFFAVNLGMLLAAYILLGMPWGIYQSTAVAYAAEVMPVQLRPFLTTYTNLAWVIGQIIGSGVMRAMVNRSDQWAYRIPFAIQWIWILPIGLGVAFAPESPWWSVRVGKMKDAENAVMRLTSRGSGFTREMAAAQVAMINHTNELEKSMDASASYKACFTGSNRRRTEIAMIVWLIQTTCGSPLMGQAAYFLTQAGMTPEFASTLNLIMFVVGGVGTVTSWFLMGYLGRRTLYIGGQALLFIIMLITGVLGTIPSSDSTSTAVGALLIIFALFYNSTVGPVCYSLVAEIGSTRLRSKTVVLGRNMYNIGGIVVAVINPLMLNPGDWNWGPKSAYLWAGLGVCGLIWSWFRLPEPKGRTYGELDILFERKIPARQFKNTIIDEFEAEKANQGQVAAGVVH